jgi:Heterokaryon incompatibility protein (HET)
MIKVSGFNLRLEKCLIISGFSNEQKLFGGTYKNSCTWFVASVITPGGHDRVPRRVLQYNVHASAKFRSHEIIWGADSCDTSIREWVNAIRREDTIQIIPKAQYPAWINFVQEAEIEVYYSETPPDTPDLGVPKQVVTLGATVPYNRTCYGHLDEAANEVRLAFLNPGASEEPISCSLAYTSLQGPPGIAYEALSYCWGDPRQRRDISLTVPDPGGLSEYILSITLSLHSALKSLRPKTGPARILWIDSICINQANIGERASQVSLMREIYRKAKRVVVWLGEGNELTQKSIQTVNTISDRYERSSPLNIAERDLVGLHDPLMKDLNVHVFVDEWPLFDLPWFRRTWVVQEIFNARAVVVCCGEDTLTWPMVLRVNKCIGLSGMKMNSSYKALMPPIFEDLFDSRVATDSTWSTGAEILEILIKGLDLDAADPRDKIFAMLQFGKETRDLSLLPADLVPDYRKSTAEVFSNFTKWWIMEHRSLRILSAIQALEGRTWQ